MAKSFSRCAAETRLQHQQTAVALSLQQESLVTYLVSQTVCLPVDLRALSCCSQRLVRPAEPVTDFRTAVTGRTAADLQAVDYSREDAQRDVLSLLQGVPAAIAAFSHLVWSHHWLRATCSPWVTSRQACSTHQLCCAGARAVLVGHAVHHDLRALRLDYQPVIDTSLLLAYRHGQSCLDAFKPSATSLMHFDVAACLCMDNLAPCVCAVVSCPSVMSCPL